MSQPIDIAVDTYVRAWNERDRAVREMMIDECFAAEGRLVTRDRVVHGRAGLRELMSQFLAASDTQTLRVISAIDALGTTFRFRTVVERPNTMSPESLVAGEVDAKGRIALILTFDGPLSSAESNESNSQ